jgi:hypothetical protein
MGLEKANVLDQATKTQGFSRSIALLFNLGASWGGWAKPLTTSLSPRQRDAVPIVQKNGWVPGPEWTGAESLVTTGIRSPDHKETIDAQNVLLCKTMIYDYEDICANIYCNDVGVPG